MGGIFSNNVLLGIPLAKVALGDASAHCVPSHFKKRPLPLVLSSTSR